MTDCGTDKYQYNLSLKCEDLFPGLSRIPLPFLLRSLLPEQRGHAYLKMLLPPSAHCLSKPGPYQKN